MQTKPSGRRRRTYTHDGGPPHWRNATVTGVVEEWGMYRARGRVLREVLTTLPGVSQAAFGALCEYEPGRTLTQHQVSSICRDDAYISEHLARCICSALARLMEAHRERLAQLALWPRQPYDWSDFVDLHDRTNLTAA